VELTNGRNAIFLAVFFVLFKKDTHVLHFCKKNSTFAFWKQPMQNQFKMVVVLVFEYSILKRKIIKISCL
ncbi:MAG: hypothetical protein IKX51_09265, partial [Bacteroidales bacterium]|nr:hypothetical protein [Bacteroidales bacterium]